MFMDPFDIVVELAKKNVEALCKELLSIDKDDMSDPYAIGVCIEEAKRNILHKKKYNELRDVEDINDLMIFQIDETFNIDIR